MHMRAKTICEFQISETMLYNLYIMQNTAKTGGRPAELLVLVGLLASHG